ncbi:MAG: DUF1501 domain-containing protein [Acidobacteriota bacterium]
MGTTRRQFIKRSVGAVSVGLVMPHLFINTASGQSATAANRKVLVIIEFSGGNDGLNTVIPYTDRNYYSWRPTIGLRDAEIANTKISNELALHPSMGKLKTLYDAGKVAVITGVGYPNPNRSHFTSADIWHTANINEGRGIGWLGRYADVALINQPGLAAVSIVDRLPKTFAATQKIIPNIPSFDGYGIKTDCNHEDNRQNIIDAFLAIHRRNQPANSFIERAQKIGLDAVAGALDFQAQLDTYQSTIEYPDNNNLAQGLQLIARIITTVPESSLLYARIGGFDTHADQIDGTNRLAGQHAGLLQDFSDAIKAFYDDMAEHGLANNVLMMQWSEFGRRVNENKSVGTDHGTMSCMFVIGGQVQGGIYGRQPSLAGADLDDAGDPKFTLDFRSVYATILDKWLTSDSKGILNGQFENLGFLG